MEVYRPSRFLCAVLALLGTFFAFIGLSLLVVHIQRANSSHDWGLLVFFSFFAFFGTFAALAGFSAICYRIQLDRDGMARLSLFGIHACLDSWVSLRYWTTGKIDDAENPNRFYVEFDFEHRPKPFRIEASMVANPGFQAFVDYLRMHVGRKEILEVADNRKRS